MLKLMKSSKNVRSDAFHFLQIQLFGPKDYVIQNS